MAPHLQWHIAQLNVGRTLAPLDDPRLAGFVDRLDAVNALADSSPGFVWRLQDDAGNATNIKVTDDPQFIINLSVWRTIEELSAFVYGGAHTKVLTQRGSWFEAPAGPHVVLWWVPAGHQPTPAEALERLDHLANHGPTARAFTFNEPYPPPAESEQGVSDAVD